ncbi:MAG: hypothetical protein E7533_04650 [Ruminococcaceae bacterium]|nr:hypothetical protein [Oscillospiraceae bacterium]
MYDMNLCVPNFNSPKYTNENRFLLLKNYLYELNDMLAIALSENESQVVERVSRAVEKGDDTGKELLRLKKESLNKFAELKNEIIRTADEICTAYASDIDVTQREILASVGREYLAKADHEEYKNSVDTALSQTADRIEATASATESVTTDFEDFKKHTNAEIKLQADSILSQVEKNFTTRSDAEKLEERVVSRIIQDEENITESFSQSLKALQDDISSVGGEVSTFVSELDVYIRRGKLSEDVFGIEIGRSDSGIKARFTNDRLSFYQGASEVAYISGSNLYITRAQVLDYLKIGNSTDGFFTFDITSNGLEVRWSDGG